MNTVSPPCPTEFDPQMWAAMLKTAELADGDPDRFTLSPVDARLLTIKQRRFWNRNLPDVDAVLDASVDGPFGGVPLQIFYPTSKRPLPTLVYIHGGGWVFGALETHELTMRLLALHSGCAVVGVDYVLAPEHKFPDPILEIEAVVRHIIRAGSAWGLDPERIALAGDSAGANIALGVALDSKEEFAGHLKALALFYGVFDSDLETESYQKFGDGSYGLSTEQMDYFWKAYRRTAEDGKNPLAAPVYADLSGLPPLYLAAAGLDPLRDDTLRLVDGLKARAADHTLSVFDGVCHGFVGVSPMVDKGRQAIEEAAVYVAMKI